MHDNRPMLLKHIDRILEERVRPATTQVVTALDVESWAAAFVMVAPNSAAPPIIATTAKAGRQPTF